VKRFLSRWMKDVWWSPPRPISAGSRSYIYRPRRIDGPQFIHIGARSTVDRYSWLSALGAYAGQEYSPRIVLGDDVHIGRYACITSISSIVVDDGCLLSEYVYISDLAHGVDPEGGLLVDQPLVSKGPVRIGAHSFIGYRSCIMPGVALGRHCVVGANSVVTRSFSDYSMVAGCPARLVKKYSLKAQEWVLATESQEND
jgi:acetyltransferase-like isoleucine patch superfamily enzyme